MRRIASKLSVAFASYSTGARTLTAAGETVHNLGLPESNPYLATMFKAGALIAAEQPDIVISQEEFAAIPAAKLLNVPCIFLGTWLPPERLPIWAESLCHASSIVIMGDAGVFPAPRHLNTKPRFTGQLLRAMRFTRTDGEKLRREANVSPTCFIVTVVPGGAVSEAMYPMLEMVLSAFLQLPSQEKRLMWLSNSDREQVQSRTMGIAGVEVLPFVDPIERILAMSDIVITRGTHGITLDCAAVGVPSISLSPETNPIDEVLIPRLPTNLALNLSAITDEILRDYILKVAAESPVMRPRSAFPTFVGPDEVATVLLEEINRLVHPQHREWGAKAKAYLDMAASTS